MAASRFQSPAQREAAALPPAAQPVVVQVARGDLDNRATMMATAAPDDPRTQALPAFDGAAVVTGAGVPVGGTLTSGSVATWVNGRPVIALRGPFPFYRDIGEGDSGEDVRMLQQALADLGYGISPDGDFGAHTAQRVRDLYASVGSQAPERSVEEEAPTDASGAGSPADNASGSSGTGTPTAGTPSSSSTTPRARTPRTQIYVPASEVAVLSSLPARVGATPSVGTVLGADNATLTLTGDGLSLTGKVPGDVAARLSTGTTGTAQAGDQPVPVRVEKVVGPAEATSSSESGSQDAGTDPSQSVVVFAPVQGALPAEWAGNEQVLVTLDLSAPVTDALLVPQRAVATDASGGTSVLLRQPDGSFTQTPVDVRSCVGGTCALAEATGVSEGATLRVDR
jgi:peptidoglycan hydrolase-like protein with peptidoglycan-binding domain